MTLSDLEQRLFRQAALATRANRFEDAEVHYRRWMRLSPKDPRPAYGLGIVLLTLGKYEEGFRLYEARAHIPETGIVKPAYRPRPLPLPPEVANGEVGRRLVSSLPPVGG